jgi:hypothetical protein
MVLGFTVELAPAEAVVFAPGVAFDALAVAEMVAAGFVAVAEGVAVEVGVSLTAAVAV